jgi:hypothetical protein
MKFSTTSPTAFFAQPFRESATRTIQTPNHSFFFFFASSYFVSMVSYETALISIPKPL